MKTFRLFACLFLIAACCSVNAFALDTSAKAAVLINGDTNSVIYSHNMNLRLPMASTTKIMTALLLAEQGTPERVVTASKAAVYVEGSSMGLKVGDTVSFGDLLYGILLPSGNDAANLAALSVAGTTQKFAELMNNKVREFGLHNTNFVTPSGLDAEGHYTTAYDLAVITANALKNNDFAAAVATYSKTVEIGDRRVTLTNHNKLLKAYPNAIGVKTGYTSLAGRCLVSAATLGGATVIAVTLNDKNDWNDHAALLDYGLSCVKSCVVSPELPLSLSVLSAQSANLELISESLEIGLCNNEKVNCNISLMQNVFAPVSVGEKIGTAQYYVGERLVATKDVLAKNSVDLEVNKTNFFEKFIIKCINLFRSI